MHRYELHHSRSHRKPNLVEQTALYTGGLLIALQANTTMTSGSSKLENLAAAAGLTSEDKSLRSQVIFWRHISPYHEILSVSQSVEDFTSMSRKAYCMIRKILSGVHRCLPVRNLPAEGHRGRKAPFVNVATGTRAEDLAQDIRSLIIRAL